MTFNFNFRLSLAIFISHLALIHTVKAQSVSPFFNQYTTENGLPSSEVYDVLQDKNGIIWFGTDRGISKYDGYKFETYSYKDGLYDNTVFKLFEDKNKRLWMLTYSGRIFYFEKEKILPYKFNDILFRETQSRVPLSFQVDSTGLVTLSIRDLGIIQINSKGELIEKFTGKDYPGINFFIDEQMDHTMIVSVFEPAEKNKSYRILHSNLNKQDTIEVKTSYSDRIESVRLSNGRILFSLGKNIYEKTDHSVILLNSLPGKIYSMYEDSHESIWVGTEFGVFQLVQSGGVKIAGHYLELNNITNILEDHEGGYWFTTLNSGVYYMSGYGIRGIPFNTELFQKPISLATDFHSAIYAGCWNGSLVKINGNDVKILYNPGKESNFPVTNLSCFPNDPRIYLCRSLPGYYLNDRFYMFKSKRILGIKTNFLKRSDGFMYSAGTAFIFKNKEDSLIQSAVTSQRINCIAESKDRRLLLGCNRGVFVYNDKSEKTELFIKELDNIRVDDIKWLNNILIFATKGRGLIFLINDSIFILDESKGLCSNLVNKILVKGNEVWCSTNKGISHIVLKNSQLSDYKITNIHSSDGLFSDEINDLTILNNTVYVATNSGISFFHTETDFVNHTKPPVYITLLKVNNSDTAFTEKMKFKNNQNNIQIGFNGISYRSKEKIKYYYKLTKGDDTLSSLTSNREVEFLSLNPGDYTFTVSAMNSSGIWSESPSTFSFTILPAWWQTIWFKIILSFIIASGIFVFYKNKVKNLKSKFETERRQASLQLTAMRAQMNPHFIFNAMNSIRNYMQNHDMKSAEKYLISFSKLVRYTLDNSEVQEVSLEEELNALQSYTDLEMQRFENGFEFKIICEEGIDLKETMLLSMLLQPIVENSIKHGINRMACGGKILIDIRKSDDSVIIAVEDNGVGMQEASDWNKAHRESHISHGSSINLERIKAYNRVYNKNIKTRIINLEDNEGRCAGTRVEVEV